MIQPGFSKATTTGFSFLKAFQKRSTRFSNMNSFHLLNGDSSPFVPYLCVCFNSTVSWQCAWEIKSKDIEKLSPLFSWVCSLLVIPSRFTFHLFWWGFCPGFWWYLKFCSVAVGWLVFSLCRSLILSLLECSNIEMQCSVSKSSQKETPNSVSMGFRKSTINKVLVAERSKAPD